jgi:hypothetical protein
MLLIIHEKYGHLKIALDVRRADSPSAIQPARLGHSRGHHHEHVMDPSLFSHRFIWRVARKCCFSTSRDDKTGMGRFSTE